MAEPATRFEYVAMDATGRKAKGVIAAASAAHAFDALRRGGFSPLKLAPASAGAAEASGSAGTRDLTDQDAADLVRNLAILLRAGSHIRLALSITGERSHRAPVRAACRIMTEEVSGGSALHEAFTRAMPRVFDHVGSLVAAGEASGALAPCLERIAAMIEARMNIRRQLAAALTYPAFVLVSTILAMGLILLFVVPSLAPLVEAPGVTPPLSMRLMLGASGFLRDQGWMLAGGLLAGAGGTIAAARVGLLAPVADRMLWAGPLRKTSSALVFGAYAVALGDMLGAGAPMSEALRLAARTVRNPHSRERLAVVAHHVRQGEDLSVALQRVRGFPTAVARMAAIGEASGSLGSLLSRAGAFEEEAAVRRIEAGARVLGPALIVLLGALIGVLMAGLLSGVTQLGDAALG